MKLQWRIIAVHTQGVGGRRGQGVAVWAYSACWMERLAIVHCTLQHILATNASVSAAPRRGISNPPAHPLPLRLFRLLLLFLLPLEATSGRLCCPNGVWMSAINSASCTRLLVQHRREGGRKTAQGWRLAQGISAQFCKPRRTIHRKGRIKN